MYERQLKEVVEKWVNEQETCPNRKKVARHFPNMPHRIIRSVIAARKDRERSQGTDES